DPPDPMVVGPSMVRPSLASRVGLREIEGLPATGVRRIDCFLIRSAGVSVTAMVGAPRLPAVFHVHREAALQVAARPSRAHHHPPRTTMAQASPTLDDRTEAIAEWVREHVREVSIIAVVVIVLAAGTFAYLRMSAATVRNAEQAFFSAQALRQGADPSQAEAELSKVSTQFRGTAGGTQAAMVVAQLRFDAGKYAEGLQAQEQLKSEGISDEF